MTNQEQMTPVGEKVMLHKRADNDFTYHTPPPHCAPDFAVLRSMARELAHKMIDVCPVGRELSSALTNLEQAVMHANAGIARQYPKQ